MTTRKLISLNIEGDKHLNRVGPFLQQEQPDVLCVQEIFEETFEQWRSAFGWYGAFVPITTITEPCRAFPNPRGKVGIAQLSRWPLITTQSQVIQPAALSRPVPIFKPDDPNSTNRAVMWSEIKIENQLYRVVNTHFTWSPAGSYTPEQKVSLEMLLDVLKKVPDFLLCGDLNSPRNPSPLHTQRHHAQHSQADPALAFEVLEGPNVYQTLATQYQDHIPAECTTTLDPDLHYAGKLDYVVDGLFSTPEYNVSDVQIVPGLSDHQAVRASVIKSF